MIDVLGLKIGRRPKFFKLNYTPINILDLGTFLVAGAAGFIGSSLLKLVDKNNTVVTVDEFNHR